MRDDDERRDGAPAMERARRLAQLWSYLPAFRVVAELEHLPSAAARLSTSASALSRSVRLLEGELGVPLFVRVGRRLVLNAQGRLLLDGVRDAMRLLDDAVVDVKGGREAGTLRVWTDQALASTTRAVLTALARESPMLTVVERNLPAREVGAALLRGELDVAVVVGAPPDARGLDALALAPVRYAVARPKGGGPAFVAYDGEPWPEGSPREVLLSVSDLASACATAVEAGLSVFAPLPLPAALETRRAAPTCERHAFAVIRRVLRSGGLAEDVARRIAARPR